MQTIVEDFISLLEFCATIKMRESFYVKNMSTLYRVGKQKLLPLFFISSFSVNSKSHTSLNHKSVEYIDPFLLDDSLEDIDPGIGGDATLKHPTYHSLQGSRFRLSLDEGCLLKISKISFAEILQFLRCV